MAKSILIVDDSATVLMSFKTYLEAVGFIIETADDGVKVKWTPLSRQKIS